MTRVLFVCLGNICRSPMAEAVMRHLVQQKGVATEIEVASRGTSGWESGKPPHRGTQNSLERAGIAWQGIVSEQITSRDLTEFDFILAMDTQNLADLQALASPLEQDKLFLFLDAVPGKQGADVPDPYYTGDFEKTYELVVAGCQAWLTKILEEVGLKDS